MNIKLMIMVVIKMTKTYNKTENSIMLGLLEALSYVEGKTKAKSTIINLKQNTRNHKANAAHYRILRSNKTKNT
jgi:hypothetical protein